MRQAILNHFQKSFDTFFGGYVQKIKKLAGAEFIGLCPFHQDSNPSFNFNGDTGQYKCHGCGATGDIFTFYAKTHDLDPKADFHTVLSRMSEDLGLTPHSKPPQAKIVKTYDYVDENGGLLFQVCRMEPKDFRQRRPGGKGKWIWNLNGTRRVLYNLPKIMKAERILLVEGEKDVDNLTELGFIATTSPMGAGKWLPEYNQALHGKDVVLIPDNDPQGREHMSKAAESLNGTAKSLKWLDLLGLPEKGDASDLLAKFGDKEDAAERLSIMLENAEPYKPKPAAVASTEKSLAPLTPQETSIADFLCEPPKTQYLFENILPRKLVGAIVGMGGVSKGFFVTTLGIALATGKPVLKHFKPVKPTKVLMLFSEDPAEEIHRRTYFTAKHVFENPGEAIGKLLLENLHTASLMGRIKPLMRLEQGNPVTSESFEWLKRTIEAHKGLEVLILDPKSRLFGLEENNNDHNTQWVSCLESLVEQYGLTILFTHHVNKVSGGALNQSSARGGSALVDACRWVGNLRTMDEAMAKKYEVENPKGFVEFDISKSNFAPQLPGTIFFRRGEHGVLMPVNLESERLKSMAGHLCCLLQEHEIRLSRRELVSQKAGKDVRDQMKERFGKFNRRDLTGTVEYAIKEGMISEFSLSGSARSKGILTVEIVPERAGAQNRAEKTARMESN